MAPDDTSQSNAFQTAQRATIREERRRLARTRRYLQAALGQPPEFWASTPWAKILAFYQACIRYLEVATKRLIAQDISLVEQLRPTLPRERVDDHAFLDELETRLRMREMELADLTTATHIFAQQGASGLKAFGEAVTAYFTAPSTTRSRPMHSLPPLIEAYGAPDAWANAQAAAERCGSEVEAFDDIERKLPPGLSALADAMTA